MDAEGNRRAARWPTIPDALVEAIDTRDVATLTEHLCEATTGRVHRDLITAVADRRGGLHALLSVREVLLSGPPDRAVCRDLAPAVEDILADRFAPATLEFRTIDAGAPTGVLDHVVTHETVHPLRDRDELRRRLDPVDRRCFCLVNPDLGPEPIVFVEIALTHGIETSVQAVLDAPPNEASEGFERSSLADTAMFYAIVKCEPGLRGIAAAPELLHRAIDELEASTNVRTFCTLSPIPGMAAWADPPPSSDADRLVAGARFLLTARQGNEPLDPVARFHLGNGARLERINPGGNASEVGEARSLGLTANYLYERAELRANQAAYDRGEVVASPAVRSLLEEL